VPSLTPQRPAAVPNWWSVVMNIYAHAGLNCRNDIAASGRLPGPIVSFVLVVIKQYLGN